MYCNAIHFESTKILFFIKTLCYNLLLYNKLRLIKVNLSLFMTFVIFELLYFISFHTL